ncbi:protein adenylyltransferase SelO family protein [Motilimonas cestriensis]|uniref:Protein nucleotidyltransferase YdiU n=1 Tax=Motilimonas cestriensis TaxID=2742685 RepID=A0ABS8W7F3_9GAMM|nr:protein adenylyltransferase SelO family protein [Motilimonas cestriensis]MCE2593441.1 protein adenylyltransferase SelO family protein [Motilimonas cestriensis]
MTDPSSTAPQPNISDLATFAKAVDYSLMEQLTPDPDATADGHDHYARQVFSGHYVPVKPTAIADANYVSHSQAFFAQLGLADALAHDASFRQLFSGDLSNAPAPMKRFGWATGYALSIYGTEYTQQCPFHTGNGYGDGRAMSIFEGVFNGQRYEMQLKGGGPTPYCRGADGRAVLRSSVREFLAQEYMHNLGVPSSRSLTLYVSKSETVSRPWYSSNSYSADPDVMVENPVAISTRVAPSFLRVGQIELFARRVRDNAHDNAFAELKQIVVHLIAREYKSEIDVKLGFNNQVIELAKLFQVRLSKLIANWLRVGYCQGNFNSDNCAAGGFTLDYGPFGFCEAFDPEFQPWTGGGKHFSFFNQPAAAEANFHMLWTALRPLLAQDEQALAQLDDVRRGFKDEIQQQCQSMWAAKLGSSEFHPELFGQLMQLMIQTKVDYTIFFRELSHIPNDISSLKKSFYLPTSAEQDKQWQHWLDQWLNLLANEKQDLKTIASNMKRTNPKYTWREWLVAPAYQQAMRGDYSLIEELKQVFSAPYGEQTKAIEEKYYRLRPQEYFRAGGISHYSCSS